MTARFAVDSEGCERQKKQRETFRIEKILEELSATTDNDDSEDADAINARDLGFRGDTDVRIVRETPEKPSGILFPSRKLKMISFIS